MKIEVLIYLSIFSIGQFSARACQAAPKNRRTKPNMLRLDLTDSHVPALSTPIDLTRTPSPETALFRSPEPTRPAIIACILDRALKHNYDKSIDPDESSIELFTSPKAKASPNPYASRAGADIALAMSPAMIAATKQSDSPLTPAMLLEYATAEANWKILKRSLAITPTPPDIHVTKSRPDAEDAEARAQRIARNNIIWEYHMRQIKTERLKKAQQEEHF